MKWQSWALGDWGIWQCNMLKALEPMSVSLLQARAKEIWLLAWELSISIMSKNSKEMQGLNNRFSFILSTVASSYEITEYIKMLKVDGEIVIVGVPSLTNPATLDATSLIWSFRRKVSSSLIGGIKETQEMVDYSVEKGIYPMIEMINIDELDQAYERVLKSDVLFRFVIDMKSLK